MAQSIIIAEKQFLKKHLLIKLSLEVYPISNWAIPEI